MLNRGSALQRVRTLHLAPLLTPCIPAMQQAVATQNLTSLLIWFIQGTRSFRQRWVTLRHDVLLYIKAARKNKMIHEPALPDSLKYLYIGVLFRHSYRGKTLNSLQDLTHLMGNERRAVALVDDHALRSKLKIKTSHRSEHICLPDASLKKPIHIETLSGQEKK